MATLLSDDELLIRVRAGQREHYEVLIRRYNRQLFRLVYPIVGNKSEAEDVLQETHLRALTHLDQFAGRSKFATWLGRIGVYEALGRLRRGRRFESADAAPDGGPAPLRPAPGPDPEEIAVRAELGRRLRSSIDALPAAYRSVVILRLVHELSTLETCRRLNLSEETVKTRLHRAKAMLRRDLGCQLKPAARRDRFAA